MESSELEAACKKVREKCIPSENPSNPRLDAAIQAEVWLAFWQADDLHAVDISEIDVMVSQCEVWLSGQVEDSHQRQLAECLVSCINGVTGCHNELKLRSPQGKGNTITKNKAAESPSVK